VNRWRAGGSFVQPDLAFGGEQHPAHLEVIPLADGQAEEVLGDRLHGHG
jgi:hypothetical protein